MTDRELYEKIEQYLAGELSDVDQKLFEQQIASDAMLESEVELHRSLDETFSDVGRVRLRDKLEQLAVESGRASGEKHKRPWFSPLGLAAAMTLILGLSGALYWTFVQRPSTTGELYASHFEVYPLYGTLRGDAQEARLNLARTFYENNEFERASIEFEEASLADPDNLALRFYTGVSYLAAGNAERAKDVFVELVDLRNSIFDEMALWYLALAELKSGNVEECQALLNQLLTTETTSDSLRKQAQELLEAVDEL